jgi:fructokinase
MKQCHFFKVSDEEAMLLTGRDNLNEATAELLHKTTATFAITLGKEGTLLGRNGSSTIIPSIPVSPVDTTGAGDAFVGSFLYQLSSFTSDQIIGFNETQWNNLVSNANKAGARTCEYMGAMEAFKHLNNEIFR